MLATLIGYSEVNFVDVNGRAVEGVNLFLAFKHPHTYGMRTEKAWIGSDITLPELIPGKTVRLDLDLRGKVLGLEVVEKA